MTPDTSDLLGVTAQAAVWSGIAAVAWAAYGLRRRQCPGTWGGWSAALLVLTVLYLLLAAVDIPSVGSVLHNRVQDIPQISTLRTGLFAVWLWVLRRQIDRLARGRLR